MAATLTVSAGPHDRVWCPLQFRAPETLAPGPYSAIGSDGSSFPLDVEQGGAAACVVPDLPAGQSCTFRIQARSGGSGSAPIEAVDAAGQISISAGGELVTRYIYAGVPARPYFYPMNAPGQIGLTRAFPIEVGAAGETADHPHHRSLWIAHGEVNGADNWSEAPGHASTRHESFESVTSGEVSGGFACRAQWLRADGAPILTQRLAVRVWAVGGSFRVIDFHVDLDATDGAVRFGDTKEGGILSVRVASEMDVPRTGAITNSYGAVGEAETWGKSAHWCDYSGTVGGHAAGLAIMDHPHSFRHPTHWHVRDYGLMTANPFGYAAFTSGVKDGSHVLAHEKTLSFRYRVVLYARASDAAFTRDRYLDYVAPPTARFDG